MQVEFVHELGNDQYSFKLLLYGGGNRRFLHANFLGPEQHRFWWKLPQEENYIL